MVGYSEWTEICKKNEIKFISKRNGSHCCPHLKTLSKLCKLFDSGRIFDTHEEVDRGVSDDAVVGERLVVLQKEALRGDV